MSTLVSEFHLQNLYSLPYTVAESEDRMRIFIMLDTSAREYHLIIADSLFGGWNTRRIIFTDSVSQFNSRSNTWHDTIRVEEQRAFTEYSFRIVEDFIIDYQDGDGLGLSYNFEGSTYAFTLENNPDSAQSDQISAAWKTEGYRFSRIRCSQLRRTEHTLSCGR